MKNIGIPYDPVRSRTIPYDPDRPLKRQKPLKSNAFSTVLIPYGSRTIPYDPVRLLYGIKKSIKVMVFGPFCCYVKALPVRHPVRSRTVRLSFL